MNLNTQKQLSSDELLLMFELEKILPWKYPESKLLPLTYLNIKRQGSAFAIDIMHLCSLGLPTFEILSHIRQQTPAQIIQHLYIGSVNFYEIKKLLEHFNQNTELYFSF